MGDADHRRWLGRSNVRGELMRQEDRQRLHAAVMADVESYGAELQRRLDREAVARLIAQCGCR